MPSPDFYVPSRPSRLGAWMGEQAQRRIVHRLHQKYGVRRVLEIGTGKGIVARACRAFGLEYLGIDGSQTAVEHAREQGLAMVQGYVPPLPDLGAFRPDIVLTIDTLSNLSSPEQAQEFVDAAASCLEPGGLFLAMAPDLRFARWFFWDPDLTRCFPTTRHRLGRLLHAAGLEIIESRYCLDGFGSPWWYLIYRGTKLLPYQLLDGLTYRWSRRDLALYPSLWEMIYRKAPSAYVLGRKRPGGRRKDDGADYDPVIPAETGIRIPRA